MAIPDKLAKAESRISLFGQLANAVGWAFNYLGVWPYFIAGGTIVFAAILNVSSFVWGLGWPGWVLAACASVFVVSLVATALFSALQSFQAFKSRRRATDQSAAPDGNDMMGVFEAATNVGLLKSQLEGFEEDTRRSLNKIEFAMNGYRSHVEKIDRSFSSLFLLRKAAKAYEDLDQARKFIDKVISGEWSNWDQWEDAQRQVKERLSTYVNGMGKFTDAERDIYAVAPARLSPKWREEWQASFPNETIAHEVQTLSQQVHNAHMTHINLVTKFNARIVSSD